MKKNLWVKFGWSEYYRGGAVDGNFGWLNENKGKKTKDGAMRRSTLALGLMEPTIVMFRHKQASMRLRTMIQMVGR